MKLAAGDWELELAPELGGAITRLARAGRDVLRPAPAGATEPFLLSSFAMVPYANRIANGRFETEGTLHRIAPNHEGQAHPLHGVSWLRTWDVTAADTASATLVHRHPGDAAWPWAYRAEQRFVLDEGGLAVSLTLTNESEATMPASLGFHPYFALEEVTSLQFTAAWLWLCDEQALPSSLAFPDAFGDWSAGAPVRRETLVDNSYVDWSGTARIKRADGDVLMGGEGTPVLHLYTPPGEDYFCAEPATSMPDVFNRSTPITLRSGRQHRIGMTIRTA